MVLQDLVNAFRETVVSAGGMTSSGPPPAAAPGAAIASGVVGGDEEFKTVVSKKEGPKICARHGQERQQLSEDRRAQGPCVRR